jgi:hypothetical protein
MLKGHSAISAALGVLLVFMACADSEETTPTAAITVQANLQATAVPAVVVEVLRLIPINNICCPGEILGIIVVGQAIYLQEDLAFEFTIEDLPSSDFSTPEQVNHTILARVRKLVETNSGVVLPANARLVLFGGAIPW